jgi:hypothetical protein
MAYGLPAAFASFSAEPPHVREEQLGALNLYAVLSRQAAYSKMLRVLFRTMKPEQVCSICGSESELFGTGLVLTKYNVRFFRCVTCGFIQAETPYWLAEAYSSPIARSDIGYISRNIRMARITRALISLAFNRKGKFLDYGGGYGMFVRLMRDAGFDFYRDDRFCKNLFAAGFDISDAQHLLTDLQPFELITAFEVFEHLSDPIAEITRMLQLAPAILFSTFVVPDPAPPIGSWWYYVLEHGQHIAFYTPRSLHVLAEKSGLRLYTNGESLHLLTYSKIPSLFFRLAVTSPFPRLVNLIFRRESLLLKDSAFTGL